MVFEDVIEDPEESSGGGYATSTCPIDLEDYCDWATMSTRSKEYVLLDFMSDRVDLMKPSWLYCGVRRRLVEKRRETMYAKEIEKTLDLFRVRGVRTIPGMTDAQIEEAERCFGFIFPVDYKALLRVALPVSNGFYNWADLSDANIAMIKIKLEDPFMNVRYNASIGSDWPEAWGSCPADKNERLSIAKSRMESAVPLIPVFEDNFIPGTLSDSNPVFHIFLYYGYVEGLDIWNYLQREFADKGFYSHKPGIEERFLKEIPFWSEVFG